jgi:hypothetical protein
MRYKELLTESPEIGLAKKAARSLSNAALQVISDWEFVNWHTGNNEIGKEITAAFEIVRRTLHQQYGDTMQLYRGITSQDEDDDFMPHKTEGRVLFSWSLSPKVAANFAGHGRIDGRSYTTPEISDELINKKLAQYERTGFVTFNNKKYIRNKEQPQYYNMWGRHGHITDGDNLEREFKDIQQMIIDHNEKINSRGKVINQQIPIDDIVWITNNLGSLEFIVKGHSE